MCTCPRPLEAPGGDMRKVMVGGLFAAALLLAAVSAHAQQRPAQQAKLRGDTSYAPVDIKEPFSAVVTRLKAAKPEVMRQHQAVLDQRYDLGNHAAFGLSMF